MLMFVHECQEEQSDVQGWPVGGVWRDGWPIAALHQAFSEFKVNPVLQLHWKDKSSMKITVCLVQAADSWGEI